MTTRTRSTGTTSKDPADLARALGVPVQTIDQAEANIDAMLAARATRKRNRRVIARAEDALNSGADDGDVADWLAANLDPEED